MSLELRDLVLTPRSRAHLSFPFTNESHRPQELADTASASYRDGASPAIGALLTNDAGSVTLLLSAIQAQTRLVSIPLPGRGDPTESYLAFVRRALVEASAEALVVRDDLEPIFANSGIRTIPHSLAPASRLASPGKQFELVQFTSGSTGEPRPLLVQEGTLVANILAILDRLEPASGDVTVSWLPLSHDMGLIGMLLASLAAVTPEWSNGGEIVLLPPEQFLRAPSLWLRAISERGATFTASPDFGYRLALRSPDTGLDLHTMRNAIVGGELIRPTTLREVDGHLGPLGWARHALRPAYGLAEVGLAVSVTATTDRWLAVVKDGIEFVASGRPLKGYSVDFGADGELTITAPSSARPMGPAKAGEAVLPGIVETGDLGFVTDDGSVVVTGRHDDTIVVHGRNLPGLELEQAIGQAIGVRTGRVCAVGLPTGGWIVAAEVSDDGARPSLLDIDRSIRRICLSEFGVLPDHVVTLPAGHLPMTSSGKQRRREVRNRYLMGTLTPGGV